RRTTLRFIDRSCRTGSLAGVRSSTLVPGPWRLTLCSLGVLIAIGPRSWSQEAPPGLVPLPAVETPSLAPASAKVSVEQLAERLQAMEEMNRKLADELATTKREHSEEMRLLERKYGELSKRLGNGTSAVQPRGRGVGSAPPPVDDSESTDYGS